MATWTNIKNKDEFYWYKLALDVSGRYSHRHIGEPEKYPCKVVSVWRDDPNGPYEYHHKFVYLQEVVCEHCGNKTLAWPSVDAEDVLYD